MHVYMFVCVYLHVGGQGCHQVSSPVIFNLSSFKSGSLTEPGAYGFNKAG